MSIINDIDQVKYEPIVTTDLQESNTAGVVVEVEPEKADYLGAFEESALTTNEAWESNVDLSNEVK